MADFGILCIKMGHKVLNGLHDPVRQIVRLRIPAIFQAPIRQKQINAVAQARYAVHTHKALPLDQALFRQKIPLEEIGFFHKEADPGVHILCQGFTGIRQQLFQEHIHAVRHFRKSWQHQPG